MKWRGCKNIEFIWHGEWSDPELRFKGHTIDVWSIEDFCCDVMHEEGLNTDDDKVFNSWVRKHQELIEQTIIEYSQAKEES